jgi:hypothetical protein
MLRGCLRGVGEIGHPELYCNYSGTHELLWLDREVAPFYEAGHVLSHGVSCAGMSSPQASDGDERDKSRRRLVSVFSELRRVPLLANRSSLAEQGDDMV